MEKDILENRISRIKGQVSGIEKMVQEKRSCLDIVQQIAAVRAALAKVGGMILASESCKQGLKKNPKDFERTLKELVKNL
ncbi:metal-sensitive transcriptional regulator [Patescibacteria group bacterium]